jgi:hypothetical protein
LVLAVEIETLHSKDSHIAKDFIVDDLSESKLDYGKSILNSIKLNKLLFQTSYNLSSIEHNNIKNLKYNIANEFPNLLDHLYNELDYSPLSHEMVNLLIFSNIDDNYLFEEGSKN